MAVARSSIHKKAARKTISCENCRARKVRCSRESPCQHCVKRGEDCVWKADAFPLSHHRGHSYEESDSIILHKAIDVLAMRLAMNSDEVNEVIQSCAHPSSGSSSVRSGSFSEESPIETIDEHQLGSPASPSHHLGITPRKGSPLESGSLPSSSAPTTLSAPLSMPTAIAGQTTQWLPLPQHSESISAPSRVSSSSSLSSYRSSYSVDAWLGQPVNVSLPQHLGPSYSFSLPPATTPSGDISSRGYFESNDQLFPGLYPFSTKPQASPSQEESQESVSFATSDASAWNTFALPARFSIF